MENFSAIFWMCAEPTGFGKTRAATTLVCELITRSVKIAFIQPTIALCKRPYLDARARYLRIKARIRAIVIRHDSDANGRGAPYAWIEFWCAARHPSHLWRIA